MLSLAPEDFWLLASLGFCIILSLITLIMSVRKRLVPIALALAAILLLYLGQAYYLLDDIRYGKVYILGEYGFSYEGAFFGVLYLFVLICLCFIYVVRAKDIENQSDQIAFGNTAALNHRILALNLLAISLYISIIGGDQIFNVRPNTVVGGTFGTTVILAVGLLNLIPIFMKRSNSLTIVNITIILTFLILSGTRIYVIYYIITMYLMLIRMGLAGGGVNLLFLIPIASFAILILGQASKEFFGENIEFEGYEDAIKYTLETFYTSQTEAFVSLASIIQYYIDDTEFRFTLGLELLDGVRLLVPGVLKSSISDTPVFRRAYEFSIVPSAANTLFGSFFVVGVIVHFYLMKIMSDFYRKLMDAPIIDLADLYDFVFGSYVISVLIVLITRGPLDLIFFSVIPVFIIFRIGQFFALADFRGSR